MGGFAFSAHGDILAKPEPVLARLLTYTYTYTYRQYQGRVSTTRPEHGLAISEEGVLSQNTSHDERVERGERWPRARGSSKCGCRAPSKVVLPEEMHTSLPL